MDTNTRYKIPYLFLILISIVFADDNSLEIIKQQYINTIDFLASTSTTPIPDSKLIINKIKTPVYEIKATESKPTIIIAKEEAPKPKFETAYYNFSKAAVWGDLQVNLISYENYFTIIANCSAPIVYYKLLDVNDKLLFEKTITDKDVYKVNFNTNFSYLPVYTLMINVKAEDTTNTISIPLYKKTTIIR